MVCQNWEELVFFEYFLVLHFVVHQSHYQFEKLIEFKIVQDSHKCDKQLVVHQMRQTELGAIHLYIWNINIIYLNQAFVVQL